MPLLPKDQNLFVVDLNYVAPLGQIDAVIPDHVAFLERNYATGMFLASGRKVPRTGGVILATAGSRAALEAALAEDPFARAGLAEYRVTEFVPGKLAAALEG